MDHEKHHKLFSQWSEAHRGIVFKVARSYASNASDQEDLYQEISTQIFRSIPNYKGKAKVSTWVYRVAIYTAMTWSRQEKRHQEGRKTLETHEHELIHQSSENARLEEDTNIDWLYGKIRRFKPIDRSLTLLLLDGFSYEEMAELLGISTGNVGIRIHRIKQRLASDVQTEERQNEI